MWRLVADLRYNKNFKKIIIRNLNLNFFQCGGRWAIWDIRRTPLVKSEPFWGSCTIGRQVGTVTFIIIITMLPSLILLWSLLLITQNHNEHRDRHNAVLTVRDIRAHESGLYRLDFTRIIVLTMIREGVNWRKKTFSFGHCPNYLNPPPPMTPIRATWSFFFGSPISWFESQFRTKNTIYTI